MLIYLIDAFNLIHAVPELVDSPTPHADLVRFLKANRLTGSATNRTVIVFDGHPVDDVGSEREIEILFAKNRTADAVIVDTIAKALHPRQIVVVTDDRAIKNEARGYGASVLSNREFLAQGKKSRGGGAAAQKTKELPDDDARDRITRELEKLWLKK